MTIIFPNIKKVMYKDLEIKDLGYSIALSGSVFLKKADKIFSLSHSKSLSLIVDIFLRKKIFLITFNILWNR
jgi:hypothetical protein